MSALTMLLIVQAKPQQDGGIVFRAWLSDSNAGRVELPDVDWIWGYTTETAKRMNYPTDVSVHWAYGTITVPRERVFVVPAEPVNLSKSLDVVAAWVNSHEKER